jgi:hypothetical protein
LPTLKSGEQSVLMKEAIVSYFIEESWLIIIFDKLVLTYEATG